MSLTLTIANAAAMRRARTALVTHLRAIHPPLSESAIAKERLSLESAIREVEADIASETEPRESKPLRENRSVHSGRGYALQSNFENRGISAAVAIKPSTPLAMVGCSAIERHQKVSGSGSHTRALRGIAINASSQILGDYTDSRGNERTLSTASSSCP